MFIKRIGLMAILAIISCIVCAPPAHGAQDQLANIGERAFTYAPGQVIILPDGGKTVIESILPGGNLRTRLGQIISPRGIILEGENSGQLVKPDLSANAETDIHLEAPAGVAVEKPALPDVEPEEKAPATGVAEIPAWRRQSPAIQPAEEPAAQKETPAIAQKPPRAESEKNAVPEKADPDETLTLAQMLPVTPIRETGRAEKKADPVQQKKDAPQKAEAAPAKKDVKPKAESKPEKAAQPKKTPKSETAKKPEKTAKTAPKPGEQLKIPPEAIKTGNLDFLEGCWQGTRPEYVSKRTIRECFCFGANGANGKRRIYDATYNRQCIGATRARLGKDGVLSVTSEGAACTDGERWGQAEMVCRNSGPHTPCSWIFRDANNGRQAYEIPFIRVESCGR